MACQVFFLGKLHTGNVLDILLLDIYGVVIFHQQCIFLLVLVCVGVRMRAHAPGAAASSMHLHLSLLLPDSVLGEEGEGHVL